ncbi:hypothetical protein [Weissella confusa]|uniref:hypothetical protein n=1 Tax=Weissella confusa TaxID=1583 RepID=UPI00107F8391|nr:hypothetical protein [Weissella confusa]TGE66021.1 hypothetical protein C6P17_04895 [Weissella confusa]
MADKVNKIKESVGNGLKAAQVGAGKVAEVVSAKTAEARLNMAVNGKLRRPLKSMNTTRRATINSLAKLYEQELLNDETFEDLRTRFEQQLIQNLNEALHGMVVDFATDDATKQFVFDNTAIKQVALPSGMAPSLTTVQLNDSKLINNSVKSLAINGATKTLDAASKLKPVSKVVGNAGVAGAAISIVTGGVEMAAEKIRFQMLARKQFEMSGWKMEFDDVMKIVANQIETFKASLTKAQPSLLLLPVSDLAADDTEE